MELYRPPSLIVGLGNPGQRYANTRHNVGAWLVDRLHQHHLGSFRHHSELRADIAELMIAHHKVKVMKSRTYMNESGMAVRAAIDYWQYTSTEVLVVHDEIDFPVGVVRLKRGGGAGGHNGLRSLIQHIGPDFARLRIGVGHPRDDEPQEDVVDYVLKTPSKEERVVLESVLAAGEKAIDDWFFHGWEYAVKELHTVGELANSAKDENVA